MPGGKLWRILGEAGLTGRIGGAGLVGSMFQAEGRAAAKVGRQENVG